MGRPIYAPESFAAKLTNVGGCLEWSGHRQRQGYGQVQYLGKRMLAHRLAWQFAHGPIPEGMFVCHRCDNPPCCNVQHLFLGTNDDNMKDMARKGRADRTKKACGAAHGLRKNPDRAARGQNAGSAVLSEDAVRSILSLRLHGWSYKDIGIVYGVNCGTVGAICRGQTWRHITKP